MTLRMRPSVPGPTGTMIGAPVSFTSWPLTRPSVACIMMQDLRIKIVNGWSVDWSAFKSDVAYAEDDGIRINVTSILMVRTVFSPRCWATSSTRRGLPAATVTSRALRIGGSGPSNC
jgi:hypothetical protein